MKNLVVVESPLAGDWAENFRYMLWCCRQEYLAGNRPIASHLICPWFMDDTVATERADGIEWPWMWSPQATHVFYNDRGASRGMGLSLVRCAEFGIPYRERSLDGECRLAWCRGEWPPHTPAFELREAIDRK
jgi:hypothetical protein